MAFLLGDNLANPSESKLIVMIILIPLPLFFASTVYGVGGLTAWVVIGIIWTFLSAFTVVVYPLWESREALRMITRGMVKVCVTHLGFGS